VVPPPLSTLFEEARDHDEVLAGDTIDETDFFSRPVRPPPLDRSKDEGFRPQTDTVGDSIFVRWEKKIENSHRASPTAGMVLRSSRGITNRRKRINLYFQRRPVKQGEPKEQKGTWRGNAPRRYRIQTSPSGTISIYSITVWISVNQTFLPCYRREHRQPHPPKKRPRGRRTPMPLSEITITKAIIDRFFHKIIDCIDKRRVRRPQDGAHLWRDASLRETGCGADPGREVTP